MMNYDNIQDLERKMRKVVYDTFDLTEKGPRNIPQKMFQQHVKTGYTRNNPALEKLYKARLDKLIIEYVKNILLYAFYNDLTNFERHIDIDSFGHYVNKQQKLVEFSENVNQYTYGYSSWQYEKTHTVPLVYIDSEDNTIDLAFFGYSGVGTRFQNDFKRKMSHIMKPVYEELKDNSEFMCWLFLCGMSRIFEAEMVETI